ncbi:coenzyme A pyrophosphatase [Geobacter sp. AOG1]|nr:coenzyme A pyrophosphatase [Geobacter sp. AOG1]
MPNPDCRAESDHESCPSLHPSPVQVTLADIERDLAGHMPEHPATPGLNHAAVALVIREGTDGPEVLFIERASRPGDPWSGDLGFPGGKVEAGDDGPREAAEREAREELDLDLGQARYIGRLTDIVGAHLPVRVSCFVYGAGPIGPFSFSDEVRDAFWVPLAELVAPTRHIIAPVRFGADTFERPSIRLPAAGKPVLWGITYRLVMQFLEIVGSHFPPPPVS